MKGLAIALALWHAAALLACAGGGLGGTSDLPREPVALLIRSESDTKKLEEIIKHEAKGRYEGREKPPLTDPLLRVQYPLEDLLYGMENRTRFTKLVFYDAAERENTRAGFAPRFPRPLAWSNDRSRLLFQMERDGRPQLFEWIKSTGEVRQRTFGRPHVGGTFGPEGRIAAVRHNPLRRRGEVVRGGLQIYVSDAGGGDLRRISEGPLDTAPAWAPDGRTLYFERVDPKAGSSLFAVEPDAARPSARRTVKGRMPVFTPEGEWLVFSARLRGGHKLWKMRADGSGRRALGKSGYQEFLPAVSPDGRHVIFIGVNPNSESGPQLLVRGMHDQRVRRLSVDDGKAQIPVW